MATIILSSHCLAQGKLVSRDGAYATISIGTRQVRGRFIAPYRRA